MWHLDIAKSPIESSPLVSWFLYIQNPNYSICLKVYVYIIARIVSKWYHKKLETTLMCSWYWCEWEPILLWHDHVLQSFMARLLPSFWRVGSSGWCAQRIVIPKRGEGGVHGLVCCQAFFCWVQMWDIWLQFGVTIFVFWPHSWRFWGIVSLN